MRATVLVRPKPGILDPQGDAVGSSLRQLGFGVEQARVGTSRRPRARGGELATTHASQVERMCAELLANPLIESFDIELAD